MTEIDTPKMPEQVEVLLERPLYNGLEISDDGTWLKKLRMDGLNFDAHCCYCKDRATFRINKSTHSGPAMHLRAEASKPGYFSVSAQCTRHGHYYVYYFHLHNRILEKVGQSPSLEDVSGADIEKYRQQLKDGAFNELRKATGLASHGIGIGAFVYLRRIFERLIYEHRSQLEQENGPIENFDALRMEEKIQALRDVLPPALVKHRAAYSILSKGLHELSEDECKLYFPVVRSSIIQMLEEDWIQRERKRGEAEISKQLQRISGELNKKPAAPKA
jgi:hypothetical protein